MAILISQQGLKIKEQRNATILAQLSLIRGLFIRKSLKDVKPQGKCHLLLVIRISFCIKTGIDQGNYRFVIKVPEIS